MEQNLTQLHDLLGRVRVETGKVIIGQPSVINQALIVILTGQHALIEGAPGVAKTLLVRTLARVLGCGFSRIQFTPDLMPADITGTSVFNLQRNEFMLVRGPVFTEFLLADEINRAPAKTQSSLLQAMQERTVTIDRDTHPLPANFTVFATQNPIEHEGTYPLPEAQKDRFMLKIQMSWPEREDELELARRLMGQFSPENVLAAGSVAAVLSTEQIQEARRLIDFVTVRPELIEYIVDLVRTTRSHESVMVGSGPRATQALLLASRAHAAIGGRDFVTPDDVRALALPVLGHRLMLRPEFEMEGVSVEEVIAKIFEQVPVPR